MGLAMTYGVKFEAERSKVEANQGIKMSKSEHDYYADMKDKREMECDKGVDPVWYSAMLRRQRLKERAKESRAEMRRMFLTKNLDEIADMISSSEQSDAGATTAPSSEDDMKASSSILP